eukprot:3778788-Amphidinium_carterae.1
MALEALTDLQHRMGRQERQPQCLAAAATGRHGPRQQVNPTRFGPGHDIRAFQVRPAGTPLYWCQTCGAYA